VDLTDGTAYLPPSTTDPWFLSVKDVVSGTTGQVTAFSVVLPDDRRYVYSGSSVSIPDNPTPASAVVAYVDPLRVALTPPNPYTDDDLVASVTGTQESPPYTYAWYKNGVLQSGETTDTVSHTKTTRSEVWRCEATTAIGGKERNEAVIQNSPPADTTASITPASPKTNDDLVCSASATDADGDPITWTYAWYKDGALQSGETTSTIDHTKTTRGEAWECVVTPNDGTNDGPSASASVTIQNSLPVANDDPNYATSEDEELVVAAPGVLANDTDADGDQLTAQIQDPAQNGDTSLNPDGSFTYQPHTGWSGTDTFTYVANDGRQGSGRRGVLMAARRERRQGGRAPSNVATVTITVIPQVRLQPDLLICNMGESTYLGDNICNADGTDQTKTQTVGTNVAAIYLFRLYNDGNTVEGFTLTAPAGAPGWAVRYYVEGGANITGDITSVAGYTVSNLEVGKSIGFWVTVGPGAGPAPGAQQDILITAKSVTDPTQLDAVRAITAKLNVRPDLWIRNASDTLYVGDDVYNSDGTNQTKAQTVLTGVTATYYFRVVNDGTATTSFRLTGPAASTGWTVAYYIEGLGEKTADFTGGGYVVSDLVPGNQVSGWVEVTPNSSAGSPQNVLITAKSVTDATQLDAVKAVTTLAGLGPDLWICNKGESTYLGNNIYNVDGTDQTKTQTVGTNVAATYLFRLYNDGASAESFKLTAPAGTAGWTVRYYVQGGANITGDITSVAGYTVSNLGVGKSVGFWVTVGPGASPTPGAQQDILITARSVTDPAQLDAVRAITTKLNVRPDLWIRNASDTLYVGDDVYNSDGTNQTKAQAVPTGVTATYYFRVVNDGTATTSFRLTGPAASTGWTVAYYIEGLGEKTADFTGGGYVVSDLAPGNEVSGWVEVTPSSSAGAPQNVLITAKSMTDATQLDVVKAVTALATLRPDLWICNKGESTYLGDNIYNADGTNQTKTQTVGTNVAAIYLFRLYNDGNVAESFTLTAPAGAPGWAVRYYVEGGANITGDITSVAGYTVSNLGVGKSVGFWVTVGPGASPAPGAQQDVLITAKSVTDPTCLDAVRAVTTKASGSPVLWGVVGMPTRTGGTQIVFGLSAPAAVEARVLNLAGRPVRTLCRDEACAPGTNTLLWDARSDAGLRVPNGSYLIELTAKAPDGATSRALQMLMVGR